jgi:hypothetical protein
MAHGVDPGAAGALTAVRVAAEGILEGAET